jgi:AraC family transcriptional regulator of adaptative response / DNA-3-methyladenine glycosylase II
VSELDPRACYTALRARDWRWDGRFFVAVKTTRIYCRPVCPARTPRFENVAFLRTAAEAEERGFRPCLRCRPEAAAGSPRWNGTSTVVARALALIDRGYLDGHGVPELAAAVGIGERQLRDLFVRHLGVGPKAVADGKRLDFARTLIDDTRLSMTEIAVAAGFSSIRRFNDAVRRRYGTAPTRLRNGRPGSGGAAPHSLEIRLAYRPPYDWPWMLEHLASRAIAGMEVVEAGTWSRSFRTGDDRGWLRVVPEPARHRVRVEVRGASASSLMPIARRVRSVLDLDADPLAIDRALAAEPALGPIVVRYPGTRLPGAWDGYETTVRAIVGQRISVRAAARVTARVVARFGSSLPAAERGGPVHLFPQPAELAHADLEPVGLTAVKARAIRELSHRVTSGRIAFERGEDTPSLVAHLLDVPGIGRWTADYVALKLADPDALPRTDLVIARCLERLATDGESWKPFRGYAAHYLWRSYAQDPELRHV